MTTEERKFVITVDVPGKFDWWFDGTSIAQGQVEDGDEAGRLLAQVYRDRVRLPRGRGCVYRLSFPHSPDPTTRREALQLLDEYAQTAEVCVMDYDDPEDKAQARACANAARVLRRRVADIMPLVS